MARDPSSSDDPPDRRRRRSKNSAGHITGDIISQLTGDGHGTLRGDQRSDLAQILDGEGLAREAHAAPRPCLVVLAGPRIGELVPVEGHLVIGRDAGSDLQLLDEGVSRRHARVSAEGDSGTDVQLVDLDSINGTWVDGDRLTGPHSLREGECFRVGQTTVVRFTWQNPVEERAQRQLLETALRDGLTHLFNERYFKSRLDEEALYAERRGAPVAVLVANVDRFDHLNRIYGRAACDQLLVQLSRVMQGAIRTDDQLARMGADNFALIARETGLDGGIRLADRLRGVVADARFETSSALVEIRLSFGVTASPGSSFINANTLLRGATTALLRAKREGRNRVAFEEEPIATPTPAPAP